MKNILKDRKGFTLIELLAVIVILAILVMVAIPAVTRYLNYSRQGTFADNAKSAISAVRNDVILNGYSSSCYYTKDQIDALLERKLTTSPFGQAYSSGSYIYVNVDPNDGTTTYSMCLTDTGGHGFALKSEGSIEGDIVELSGATQCTTPSSGSSCKG